MVGARLGTGLALKLVSVPGRELISALAESQTKAEVTFVAGASPVLQTRAPTGKWFGPTLTLLLSSPMTFQVSGLMERLAAAKAGAWPSSSAAARVSPQNKFLRKNAL